MFKHIILSLVLSLTASSYVFAMGTGEKNCLKKLTEDYSVNSFSEQLDLDNLKEEFERDFGSDKLAQAILLVRATIDIKGCSAWSDIDFSRTSTGTRARSICRLINYEDPSSLACYVESSLGRFFIHWDNFNFAYVVFNRWD